MTKFLHLIEKYKRQDMRPRIINLLCFVSLLFLPGIAFSVPRFPPPEFKETGHELPITTVPEPRGLFYEYLDVAVLVAALSLATYLVLKKRSRRGTFVLGIFSLFYFGFWRKGCVCAIGAIQNITLSLFDQGYAVPLTVIAFFILPLVFTLFFGRTFCASVCPLGAIQDVFLLRPIRVPAWLERTLGMFRYVYLGAAMLFAATGSLFIICEYDPFVSFFRRTGGLSMLLLGACFLLVGMFIGRPYCRYFCPYGVLLGWMSRASKWHATITPSECIQCRLCEDACPFGAIQKPTDDTAKIHRSQGKKRLAILLILLPVFVASGVLVGIYAGSPFSRVNPTVNLAHHISLNEPDQSEEITDAIDAFYRTARPTTELYEEARAIGGQFTIGGGILGGFLGLIIGLKMIQLSVRRRRVDYEMNQTTCLSCARCFSYCPVERKSPTDSGES